MALWPDLLLLPWPLPHRALGRPDYDVWSKPWKHHQPWRRGWELPFSSCSDMSSSGPSPPGWVVAMEADISPEEKLPAQVEAAGQVGPEQHFGTGLSPCCFQTRRYSSPRPLGSLPFLKARPALNRNSVFEGIQPILFLAPAAQSRLCV